ncbi:hypothetical protein HON03_04755 [archaeon]|nr:hypothetical protein [archaeon]MBT5287901.1 hypothetical protein [archaeon]
MTKDEMYDDEDDFDLDALLEASLEEEVVEEHLDWTPQATTNTHRVSRFVKPRRIELALDNGIDPITSTLLNHLSPSQEIANVYVSNFYSHGINPSETVSLILTQSALENNSPQLIKKVESLEKYLEITGKAFAERLHKMISFELPEIQDTGITEEEPEFIAVPDPHPRELPFDYIGLDPETLLASKVLEEVIPNDLINLEKITTLEELAKLNFAVDVKKTVSPYLSSKIHSADLEPKELMEQSLVALAIHNDPNFKEEDFDTILSKYQNIYRSRLGIALMISEELKIYHEVGSTYSDLRNSTVKKIEEELGLFFFHSEERRIRSPRGFNWLRKELLSLNRFYKPSEEKTPEKKNYVRTKIKVKGFPIGTTGYLDYDLDFCPIPSKNYRSYTKIELKDLELLEAIDIGATGEKIKIIKAGKGENGIAYMHGGHINEVAIGTTGKIIEKSGNHIIARLNNGKRWHLEESEIEYIKTEEEKDRLNPEQIKTQLERIIQEEESKFDNAKINKKTTIQRVISDLRSMDLEEGIINFFLKSNLGETGINDREINHYIPRENLFSELISYEEQINYSKLALGLVEKLVDKLELKVDLKELKINDLDANKFDNFRKNIFDRIIPHLYEEAGFIKKTLAKVKIPKGTLVILEEDYNREYPKGTIVRYYEKNEHGNHILNINGNLRGVTFDVTPMVPAFDLPNIKLKEGDLVRHKIGTGNEPYNKYGPITIVSEPEGTDPIMRIKYGDGKNGRSYMRNLELVEYPENYVQAIEEIKEQINGDLETVLEEYDQIINDKRKKIITKTRDYITTLLSLGISKEKISQEFTESLGERQYVIDILNN